MPFGLTMLVVVSILLLFGVGHRILDRLRLNDKTALLFLAAMFIGSLLPDISFGRSFSINIGGAIIPIILTVYLYVKAGTAMEKNRALLASLLAGAAVFAASKIMPDEPEAMLFDPNYIYGIISGIIAYLLGRSRRASFIAGVSGIILADIAQGIINLVQNIPAPVRLGTAGVLDAVVISGFLAVILAEVVGEFREKLQGGTAKKHMRFNHAEFSSDLGAEDNYDKREDDPGEKDKDN